MADITELVRAAQEASIALSKIAAGSAAPGHVAYLTKTGMSEIAERAQRALDDAIIIALEAEAA